jgi:hypothetical protein
MVASLAELAQPNFEEEIPFVYRGGWGSGLI